MIPSTQISILLSMFSSLVSSMDIIEFECSSKIVIDIKYTKNYKNRFSSLEYIPPEKTKIKGTLYHDLQVTGGGCFDLIIRGHQNKNEYTEMVKLKGPFTPTHMVPDFNNLHLCQDIAMERVILYNARDLYKYKQGDVSELGEHTKGHDGRLTCYHRVRHKLKLFTDPKSMYFFRLEKVKL